jgi:hypothetical protein
MAAPRPNGPKKRAPPPSYPLGPSNPGQELVEPGKGRRKQTLTRLEKTVVELYGRGVRRREVARVLLGHLCPPDGEMTRQERMRVANRRLKAMEERKWFRDRLWDYALLRADLDTPAILAGVVRKAKRGRVDAAKLALGITGRYEERGEVNATQVTVVFGGDIPRPDRTGIESQSAAEEHIEEAEYEELEESS